MEDEILVERTIRALFASSTKGKEYDTKKAVHVFLQGLLESPYPRRQTIDLEYVFERTINDKRRIVIPADLSAIRIFDNGHCVCSWPSDCKPINDYYLLSTLSRLLKCSTRCPYDACWYSQCSKHCIQSDCRVHVLRYDTFPSITHPLHTVSSERIGRLEFVYNRGQGVFILRHCASHRAIACSADFSWWWCRPKGVALRILSPIPFLQQQAKSCFQTNYQYYVTEDVMHVTQYSFQAASRDYCQQLMPSILQLLRLHLTREVGALVYLYHLPLWRQPASTTIRPAHPASDVRLLLEYFIRFVACANVYFHYPECTERDLPYTMSFETPAFTPFPERATWLWKRSRGKHTMPEDDDS